MKNKTLNLSLFLFLQMYGFSAIGAEIMTNAARMQAMDKVTGRVNEITVAVNSKISFGDFSLVLRTCKKRPAEEIPENFAFIDVADKSFGQEEYNIFRGWILSSTPGINAIEHPIYDVWLLECIDTDTKDYKMLNQEELARRDNLPSKINMQENSKKEQENIEQEEIEDKEKVIYIKEFINEDRDIEKNIEEPNYISGEETSYVSEIDEGEEPENLMLFTKMQEADNKANDTSLSDDKDTQLQDAIDLELKALRSN